MQLVGLAGVLELDFSKFKKSSKLGIEQIKQLI
jgi:hypothetical protein